MLKSSLNIALVQMTSVDSLSINLDKFETIFKSILKLKAEKGSNYKIDLVCFPENCLFMRIKASDSIQKFDLSHSAFLWIGEWAKRLETSIHLGSVPLMIDGKLFNSSIWFEENGNFNVGYQKIHLFDVDIEGQSPIRESDVFFAGESPRFQTVKGWKIGESICYDLRFSELYSKYAEEGVDALLVPSAFLFETGKAHWETLIRARAIESQCYVIASAQTGQHQSTKHADIAARNTFGNSMIVDPWGSVDVCIGNNEGVELISINKESIAKVRCQIPMSKHRRLLLK